MKKYNNLLVNGKRVVLTALLAIALMPNAKAENTQNINSAEKQPVEKTEKITSKDQLKTAGQILLTFAVMYGALVLFVPGVKKENDMKIEAMRKYAEKQKANQK